VGAGQFDMAKTLAQVQEASVTAQKEQAQATRSQAVAQTVVSEASKRIVDDARKGQWMPPVQYVQAEMAKADVSVKTTYRSASTPAAFRLVVPATLKVPTPYDVNSSADLGVRHGLIYSRP
jgi:hypothetical protein